MKYISAILLIILIGFGLGYFTAFYKNNFVRETYGYHKAYLSQQKSFYEESFLNLPQRNFEGKNIKGLLVNHHLLAKHFIASAFDAVVSKKPVNVVLLSPNHFGAGNGKIISSVFDWKTPYGDLESDQFLIKRLAERGLVSIEETPFETEHGIFNIVAFIKRTWPNAKIIPIIIKDSLNFESADVFAGELKNILPDNTFLVASLDFSHSVTSEIADLQDKKTLKAILDFELDSVKNSYVDSKPALRIFLKYLLNSGAAKFNLLNASNSSKLLKKDLSDTTSYITGFFTD